MKISTKQVDIEIAEEHFTEDNVQRIKMLLDAVYVFAEKIHQLQEGFELVEDLDEPEEPITR
jgi:hypothetical protein